MRLHTSCYALAEKWLGVRERGGDKDHPLIQWFLSLVGQDLDTPDEVPWCSGFAAAPAYMLSLPRSESARARSWINVGQAIDLRDAEPENDIVILKRGRGPQPDATVTHAPGHVGYFARLTDGRVWLLAGNQGNAVSVAPFMVEDVLATRRLA